MKFKINEFKNILKFLQNGLLGNRKKNQVIPYINLSVYDNMFEFNNLRFFCLAILIV